MTPTTYNESAGGKPAGPLARLTLPKAGRPPLKRGTGNSTGSAMKLSKHTTDAVARTVKARLRSGDKNAPVTGQAAKAPRATGLLGEAKTFGPYSK